MKKLTIYQMATCAIIAALMCILGPLSIPIGPVPVSLTNLVVLLAAVLLGAKLSTVSAVVYILLGLVGLPVFSGFQGGVAKLAGPTGGYIIGFIFLAFISGLFFEKTNGRFVLSAVGMVIGTAVLYLFGTIWFVLMMDCDVAYALSVCVVPFIPFDLVKIVIALFLGKAIRSALGKAGLIEV